MKLENGRSRRCTDRGRPGISAKLRVALPLALLVGAGLAYAAHVGIGTFSVVGWQDISLICPLGALTTMLASKTVVPCAVVSLALAAVAIVLFGRAFCAWACPVSLLNTARRAMGKRLRGDGAQAMRSRPSPDISDNVAAPGDVPVRLTNGVPKASRRGRQAVRAAAPFTAGRRGLPQSVNLKETPAPSRYLVLAGSLLSAAVFGFPAFCLICPIGLSFALVFVVAGLLGGDAPALSMIAVPVLLLAETLVFRKWCSHICPLSALMSLGSRLNRTWRPTVDEETCLETACGSACGRCAEACPYGIDPRRADGAGKAGATPVAECTKCRACAESCPVRAISLPAVTRRPRR